MRRIAKYNALFLTRQHGITLDWLKINFVQINPGQPVYLTSATAASPSWCRPAKERDQPVLRRQSSGRCLWRRRRRRSSGPSFLRRRRRTCRRRSGWSWWWRLESAQVRTKLPRQRWWEQGSIAISYFYKVEASIDLTCSRVSATRPYPKLIKPKDQ